MAYTTYYMNGIEWDIKWDWTNYKWGVSCGDHGKSVRYDTDSMEMISVLAAKNLGLEFHHFSPAEKVRF